MKSHGLQPPDGEVQEMDEPSLLPVQGLQRLPELPARRFHLHPGFAPPDEAVRAGHRGLRTLASSPVAAKVQAVTLARR